MTCHLSEYHLSSVILVQCSGALQHSVGGDVHTDVWTNKEVIKHRENRKTLPFENHFGCQYVKVVFTKKFTFELQNFS